MNSPRPVLVIDFGSQTTMLIARRIREFGVLAKVVPWNVSYQALLDDPPLALILSGGPESLLDDNAPRLDPAILSLDLPILGICYGMQLLVDHAGGSVKRAQHKEFGERSVELDTTSPLFHDVDRPLVWMSHADQVAIEGTNFLTIGSSSSCPHVAIMHRDKPIFGVQFHPEVSHSAQGDQVLRNFIFRIAQVQENFNIADFLDDKVKSIREAVGSAHVIMGLSGGVDSSVAALLIHKAIGAQLHCVYVNHGLHRQGEIEEVKAVFADVFCCDLHIVDAREQFFAGLAGVLDPEAKRKIIGRIFVDVFDTEAKRFPSIGFLGQGTLYPDVIESSSSKGASHVIKSHHNVGGLPERMKLKLLEPLRDLFKDEVRKLGAMLGMPAHVLNRQPFPGPGLAVRILGVVTEERVSLLRKADAIVREEIDHAIAHNEITSSLWQWFAILLPVKSVGVMGDARCYGDTVVIRCVDSIDAMTADWAKLPLSLLGRMSTRITNEVHGISRVLYDITQKPPGTIEWE
jgi:GMP synthase (glutamine-hydrolysing)